jgi:outer membrane protein
VAVQQQLASAERNFEVGTATITDTREAQARRDLVISQEIAAQNDLRVKRLFLDQLVGRSNTEPRPLQPELALDAPAPDRCNQWIEASAEHPSVRRPSPLDIASWNAKAEAGQTHRRPAGSYGFARNPTAPPVAHQHRELAHYQARSAWS